MKKLSDLLFQGINPFKEIDADAIPDDRKGWGSEDPFLHEIIEKVRPKTILEIGTWKGASAIYMARCVKELGLETEIICADPHTASAGLWISNRDAMHMTAKGECGTYDVFLANVLRTGMTDVITPFRATASVATSVLRKLKIQADMIYVDGSHDPIDVYADLCHVLRVVHDDSVIVCDDYDHTGIKGVTQGVAEFLKQNPGYILAASRRADRELSDEKILGKGTDSKAVIVKEGSGFANAF